MFCVQFFYIMLCKYDWIVYTFFPFTQISVFKVKSVDLKTSLALRAPYIHQSISSTPYPIIAECDKNLNTYFLFTLSTVFRFLRRLYYFCSNSFSLNHFPPETIVCPPIWISQIKSKKPIKMCTFNVHLIFIEVFFSFLDELLLSISGSNEIKWKRKSEKKGNIIKECARGMYVCSCNTNSWKINSFTWKY